MPGCFSPAERRASQTPHYNHDMRVKQFDVTLISILPKEMGNRFTFPAEYPSHSYANTSLAVGAIQTVCWGFFVRVVADHVEAINTLRSFYFNHRGNIKQGSSPGSRWSWLNELPAANGILKNGRYDYHGPYIIRYIL